MQPIGDEVISYAANQTLSVPCSGRLVTAALLDPPHSYLLDESTQGDEQGDGG